jgi:hypothetical protein
MAAHEGHQWPLLTKSGFWMALALFTTSSSTPVSSSHAEASEAVAHQTEPGEATARCSEAGDTKGKPMIHNQWNFYGSPTFRGSPVGSTIHHGPHTEIHLDVKDVLARD